MRFATWSTVTLIKFCECDVAAQGCIFRDVTPDEILINNDTAELWPSQLLLINSAFAYTFNRHIWHMETVSLNGSTELSGELLLGITVLSRRHYTHIK